MFDSEYFRTTLDADVESTDPNSAVEVHLMNGHTLRVSSVLSVHSEYVTLEVYRAPRGDGGQPARWHSSPAEKLAGAEPEATETVVNQGSAHPGTAEMLRAVVSYAGIVAVTIVPPRSEGVARVGFGV
ncbi:MAG: hypothetical protein ACYC2G_01360 [Gemmatimonadaceae bacterium]